MKSSQGLSEEYWQEKINKNDCKADENLTVMAVDEPEFTAGL